MEVEEALEGDEELMPRSPTVVSMFMLSESEPSLWCPEPTGSAGKSEDRFGLVTMSNGWIWSLSWWCLWSMDDQSN